MNNKASITDWIPAASDPGCKKLPVLLKTLKRAKGVYSFRDWTKNVGFLEFRKLAQGGK
jgi:hypothetical protein